METMDDNSGYLACLPLILDYASKHRMDNVLKKIITNVSNFDNFKFGENIRFVISTIWSVVNRKQFKFFDNIIEQLNIIHKYNPSIFSSQKFHRMMIDLKIKTCLYVIEKEDFKISKFKLKLDKYFPKEGSNVSQEMNISELKKLRSKEKKFRIFIINLALNPNKRKKFSSNHLESDYGHTFYQDVKLLVKEYLCRLEDDLPEPEIEKFLELNTLQDIDGLPQNLVDGIKKKSISERLLIDVLNSIFSQTNEFNPSCFEGQITPIFSKEFVSENLSHKSHEDIDTSQDLFDEIDHEYIHDIKNHVFVPDLCQPLYASRLTTDLSQLSYEGKEIISSDKNEFMRQLNLWPISTKFISGAIIPEEDVKHVLPENHISDQIAKNIPDLKKFIKPVRIRPCFVKLEKLTISN